MLSVSERILNAINSQNISYGELSNLTGIPKTTLFKYATGETQKIPLTALTSLSEALHISASYLACWSDDPDDYSYLNGKSAPSVNPKKEFPRVTLDITDLTPENREKLKDYYDLLYNAQQLAPKVSTAKKMA